MQAILLAAGKSNRFYPYNTDSNKVFVKIFGKTVLEHTLESIRKTGIKEVIIIVSDEEYAKNSLVGDFSDLNIQFVVQNQPLGMGDALLKSKDLIKGDFFVLNATHPDFHEFYEEMLNKKKGGVLLLTKDEEKTARYGVLKVDGDRVTDLIEKPKEDAASLRVIGIYLMTSKFIETLENTPAEHYSFEKAITTMCSQGEVYFVKTDKPATSLKYPWDLLTFKNYFLKNMESYISSSAKVSPHAVVEGKIHLEDGVEIMEGAVLKGNNYVGKNSVIGTNALIRDGSIVGDNCTVGAGTEVKNTIIMDGTKIHSGFLGDSIVGQENRLAAHFHTANKRIDRKEISISLPDTEINTGLSALGVIMGNNVQTGVNVSTMPGVIIGNNTIIGPSTSIMKNVLDNTKFYAVFKENVEKTK